MPNMDKTGPDSAGPMTGRGAGYCGQNQEDSGFLPRMRRRFLLGRGRRAGQGRRGRGINQ